MAAVLPRECHVHPVVLFNIVDSYERRNDENARVIGTLLGTNIQGVVEITNCFCVPHNESEDEVAVDMEFAKNMYDLQKKVNANEVIVGWYATGPDITDHSLLIHEYYSRECVNPVHLTIDTTLTDFKMSIKVWIRQSMGVPDKSKGTVFTPIKMKPVCHQPERVGLDALIRGQASGRRTMETVTDLQHVSKSCVKLQEMIAIVLEYVDDVVSGKIPADNQVGRFLMDLVANVPKLDPDEFERIINSNMKDLLMVVYLSNLVETQLGLNEKLTLIAQTHP
ncbi:eukaryotic translation initiation factor 3 subunit F-like [Patiria miniata]|uniref:Eukaryotic translation initiation factor 3 subunit F n=1 Tax=Patiria miniata TaxID=46514 RepID=A0A914AMM2_PATMI|nr:eukaryotic translation initiation factor 3 subunit F-like [Patiria miniata]XP_038065587.1 eukaryotic translation initiation factor 3 subunit F-like [Patiria miniata]